MPTGVYKHITPRPPRSYEWKKRLSDSLKGNKNALGAIRSKETRKKISKSHIGLKPTEKSKEKMRKAKSKSFYQNIGVMSALKQQSNKNPTSIEKKVYEELKTRGFLFETQKLINGRFVVDAYIPSLNLVIEADGDYWHSLERMEKKDKAENAYLTKCGYNLLRLSEKEINNGRFRRRLP